MTCVVAQREVQAILGTRSIRRSSHAVRTVLSVHRPLAQPRCQAATSGRRNVFLHGAAKLRTAVLNGKALDLQRGPSMALDRKPSLRRAPSIARAPSSGLTTNLGGFLNRQGSGMTRQHSKGLLKRASSSRRAVSRRFALALQAAAVGAGEDIVSAAAPTKVLQQLTMKPAEGFPGANNMWLDRICDKALDKLEDKVEDHLSNAIDAAVEKADNMAINTFLNIVEEGMHRQDEAKELLGKGELFWKPRHAAVA